MSAAPFLKGEKTMLKKTFKYIDYDGNERVEDHYFNLTKTEAMEMELSTTGGFRKMVEDIVAAQDTPEIIRVFKEMIFKAYGKKSPDGRRFIKSPELSKEFSETEAFNQLFMELATDAQAASDFVNGLLAVVEKKSDDDSNTTATHEITSI